MEIVQKYKNLLKIANKIIASLLPYFNLVLLKHQVKKSNAGSDKDIKH
jgi:hypothetical protein